MPRFTKDLSVHYPMLDASINIGHRLFEHGHSRTAFSYFVSLALQGDPDAQFNVGLCYSDGNGVEKNLRKSIEWFTLAASQGHADAQYNLGLMYLKGEGVPRNIHKSIDWFSLAARQSHVNAEINLGAIFAKGDGVAVDLQQAYKWIYRASKKGSGIAQFYLGVMYHNGEGVQKNDIFAHVWWNISASISGHENARKRRDHLEAVGMSSSEISSARQIAREYFIQLVELPLR